MDSSAQPAPIIISGASRRNTLRNIIFSFSVLILGIAAGFTIDRVLLSRQSLPNNPPLPQQVQISEKELPIGLKLLKNPIINEWRGAAKGRLIAKDENSITLQDSAGNSITVPHRISAGKHMMTSFFIIRKDGQAVPKSVPLEEIPLGVILHGDFFVVPQDNDKNKIVGSQFVYDERFQE